MPVAVMCADAHDDFRINYYNLASQQLLREMEGHTKVKADAVRGQSIDIFHREPGRMRAILSDPARLPWTAKIKLGGETLELKIFPMRDRAGRYLGPMLTWKSVTSMQALTTQFERGALGVVESVAKAASQMHQSARQLSTNASDTTARATSVAAATEETSVNVQTVASASEQLSASINEIARQLDAYQGVARQAVADIEGASDKVMALDQTAARIGEVVDLITAIASQTNLLALNATIEAARAGETGKGFAVVASEVKELAGQTARATEAISQQILQIQQGTRGSVEAMMSITQTIAQMNQISSTIDQAVRQQQQATGEISRNVQEAAAGTVEVAGSIGTVSQAAAQTGASADQLIQAAEELASQSDALKRQVDDYLAAVRAA